MSICTSTWPVRYPLDEDEPEVIVSYYLDGLLTEGDMMTRLLFGLTFPRCARIQGCLQPHGLWSAFVDTCRRANEQTGVFGSHERWRIHPDALLLARLVVALAELES